MFKAHQRYTLTVIEYPAFEQWRNCLTSSIYGRIEQFLTQTAQLLSNRVIRVLSGRVVQTVQSRSGPRRAYLPGWALRDEHRLIRLKQLVAWTSANPATRRSGSG